MCKSGLIIVFLVLIGAATGRSQTVPATTQTTAVAAPPEDAALLKQLEALDERARRVRDLSGRFTQKKFTALLKKPLVSSGTLRVIGSRMRWDTLEPSPSVMTIDEREVRIYYPPQNTLEIYPIDQRMGSLAASPLPRLESLRRHFRFFRIPVNEIDDAADPTRSLALRLRPSEESLSQYLDHVDVLLDTTTALMIEARMVDAGGDRTSLRFDAVKTNVGLTDANLANPAPADATIVRPLEGLGR